MPCRHVEASTKQGRYGKNRSYSSIRLRKLRRTVTIFSRMPESAQSTFRLKAQLIPSDVAKQRCKSGHMPACAVSPRVDLSESIDLFWKFSFTNRTLFWHTATHDRIFHIHLPPRSKKGGWGECSRNSNSMERIGREAVRVSFSHAVFSDAVQGGACL